MPFREKRPTLSQATSVWFMHILLVDDMGIQKVLKEVDSKQLSLALKTASEELCEKIYQSMTSRKADDLKQDVAYLGPVPISKVEAAQQRIVESLLREAALID